MNNDFDSTGRGKEYIEAQKDLLVRKTGIITLFNLVSPGNDLRNLTDEHKILDMLGGNGLLTKVFRTLPQSAGLKVNNPLIITSDISMDMIADAKANGLEAICEPSWDLQFADNSFDSVIVAYGTHHIEYLAETFQEVYRVLKTGGKVVVHDFEIGSNVDKWFHEVVDKFSITGHNFKHFTREEFRDYLTNAGFHSITVDKRFDPFCSKDLIDYVQKMYGLKLEKEKVWDLINLYFGTYKINNETASKKFWIMSRFAIVGVGTK